MSNFATLIAFLFMLAVGTPFTSAFAPLTTTTTTRQQSRYHATVGTTRMAVKDIVSEAAFDKEVQNAGDKVVVVDYSTTWCGPCKVIAPKFAEFSEKYASDALFFSVVGDASADASKLMKREGVRSVPSFHFWVKNEKVDVVNGANPEAIEAALKKAIG